MTSWFWHAAKTDEWKGKDCGCVAFAGIAIMRVLPHANAARRTTGASLMKRPAPAYNVMVNFGCCRSDFRSGIFLKSRQELQSIPLT